ncbi:MAG: M23 family metallopeptidase [Desulfobulbaceae bacterium]|nr:M23 family metallopeptidase [Desulfobulbaceae bacterium]
MSDSFEKMTAKKSAKSMIITLFFLLLIGATAIAFYLYFEREKPQMSFHGDITTFGLSKEVKFTVTDSRSGISLVEILLSQGTKSAKVYEKEFSRQGFFEHNGPKQIEEVVTLESGTLGFKDGTAELQVTVRDFSYWNWMTGNETVMTYPVTMDTRPPKISILHSTRYVNPGGSGMVVYKIDDTVEKHGLTVNGHFNPGFPVSAEDDSRYVAYFGLNYDTEKIDKAIISATDIAGNTGNAAFGMILKKQTFKKDQINISENFLNLKIPEFSQEYPQLSGSLVEQFIYMNSKVRKENYDAIVQACSNPSPSRLWHGKFGRMAGSRMAGFAEHRTYYYNNTEIDQQVHLGVDLASIKRAEIKAANRGNVAFAEYLGIYGNSVILDHGQGIFSLYSHMSQIDVAVGELIDKGSVIGLSGNSGMAGGDHLHFSILINGIFVTPLEWWDLQWLQMNIEDVLYGNKPM